MPSPPIQVFLTTIASQPALRQRQEYILRILHVKKIPFISYDVASNEDAKRLWKRKAPPDKAQLPGILVGGQFRGTFAEFEDAVEYNELDQFLRLKEEYDPSIEEVRPILPQETIGVPGAVLPAEMTPERHKTKMYAETTPLAKVKGKSKPVNKGDDTRVDVGQELEGFGLQGVKVSEEELLSLVEELGLGSEEADELVKGLGIGEKKEDKSKDANPPPAQAPETEKEEASGSVRDLKPTDTPNLTEPTPGPVEE